MQDTYYGIEINHRGHKAWHSWGKLYKSLEIAEEAKRHIIEGNKRLVDMGSKWRIFELKRVSEVDLE